MRKDDIRIIAAAAIGIWVLLILFNVSEANAKEVDCEKHSIYCNIVDKKPRINKSYAMKLSNIMYKYSKMYGQNPHISVAVGMQETGLRNIHRKQNIIVYDDKLEKGYKIVRGYTDVCMFQFHVNTITSHGLDPVRLKNDMEYCVEQHFKLMRQKRKICSHLGEDSWTCYHSVNKIPREYYKKLVERYF